MEGDKPHIRRGASHRIRRAVGRRHGETGGFRCLRGSRRETPLRSHGQHVRPSVA